MVERWTAQQIGLRTGTGQEAVNDAALAQFATHAKTRNVLHEMHFEPAEYVFTVNTWARGIKRLALYGYATTLTNTLASGVLRRNRWFDMSTPWGESTVDTQGHYLSTVSVGDMVITFTTTVDSESYAVGDRVLIGSYNQQFSGFPVNLRYFEFNEVAAVDTVAGTVDLKSPAKFLYRSDHPFHHAVGVAQNMGKALIINLDRNDYVFPDIFICEGFIQGTNSAQVASEVFTGRYVRVRNITVQTDLVPTIADDISLENCHVGGTIESDKWLNRLLIRNCQAEQHENATACHELRLEHNRFRGDRSSALARKVYSFGNLYRTNSASGTVGTVDLLQPWGPVKAYFERDEFVREGGGITGGAINDALTQTLTADAIGAADEILLNLTAPNESIVSKIYVGLVLVDPGVGNLGTITAITQDGSNFIIEGTWQGVLVPDTITAYEYIHTEAVDNGDNVVHQAGLNLLRST